MVGSDQYYQMHHRAVTAKGSYSTKDGRLLACVGEVDQGDFMQLPPVDRLPLFEPLPWDVLSTDELERLAEQSQHAATKKKEESSKKKSKNDLREQQYRYECYWGQQRWNDAEVVTCPVVAFMN